jgi:hypothetical protein
MGPLFFYIFGFTLAVRRVRRVRLQGVFLGSVLDGIR